LEAAFALHAVYVFKRDARKLLAHKAPAQVGIRDHSIANDVSGTDTKKMGGH
jgi:hypothetical protein